LNSSTDTDSLAAIANHGQVDSAVEANVSQLPGPNYDRTGRAVSFTAIILLFMVIIVALIIRFWPDILHWLGQIIPWMKAG